MEGLKGSLMKGGSTEGVKEGLKEGFKRDLKEGTRGYLKEIFWIKNQGGS